MLIGLITDTHLPGRVRTLDELGDLPGEFLSSVDLILHGGDLTSPMVLDWCQQFAPVICSTGNNDPIPDPRMKEVQVLDIEGWLIGMIHSLEGQFRPIQDLQEMFPEPVQIMISGHTHQERLEYRDGVCCLASDQSESTNKAAPCLGRFPRRGRAGPRGGASADVRRQGRRGHRLHRR